MGQSLSLITALESYLPSFLQRLLATAQLREPPPRARGEETRTRRSLPNELLLHIFSFLELKPYIISRGVCKEWNHLLPLAGIHPIRRRLLHLFNTILETPGFEKTLVWATENLQSFDRQAYVNALLAQYPVIPEEFRMWILEWPERLVMATTWPALPFVVNKHTTVNSVYGVNWIAYNPVSPILLAPQFRPRNSPKHKRVPALLIWRQGSIATYLVFDQEEAFLFGRVYVAGSDEDEGAGFIPNGLPFYDSEDEDVDYDDRTNDWYMNPPYADWICFLEHRWAWFTGKPWRNPLQTGITKISRPLTFHNGHDDHRACPAPLWTHEMSSAGVE